MRKRLFSYPVIDVREDAVQFLDRSFDMLAVTLRVCAPLEMILDGRVDTCRFVGSIGHLLSRVVADRLDEILVTGKLVTRLWKRQRRPDSLLHDPVDQLLLVYETKYR